MASVSSSSSVGNTSLQGYGGLVSGIDRDSIIEAMTSGTTTKISNQKKAIQNLQWKQEAFQSISDKLIAIQDNYFSYTASKNLKSTSTFARNQISVLGDSDITKYVTASGTSNMADYVALKGVAQLATSASQKSATYGESTAITTGDLSGDVEDAGVRVSKLKGTTLTFSKYDNDGNAISNGEFEWTFPDTYKDKNGDSQDIKYTGDMNTLVEQLNIALKDSSEKVGGTKIGDVFKFALDGDGKISIVAADKKNSSGEVVTDDAGNPVASESFNSIFVTNGYKINANRSSSALEALGYQAGTASKGIEIADFNSNITKTLENSSIDTSQNKLEYLADKKFSVTYGGETKTITLFTEEELGEVTTTDSNGNKSYNLEALGKTIQKKFDKAFGSGKVTVELTTSKTGFSFNVTDDSQALSLNSSDSAALKEALGITKPSTKLSLTASLEANGLTKNWDNEGIIINGVPLKDINKDSTINDLLSAINENSDIGVKATYLESTNQFVLISIETGSGREISLDSMAAQDIFGYYKKDDDGYLVDENGDRTTDKTKTIKLGGSEDGKDAKVVVDYGDGQNVLLTSSSNTVNIAGMKVTVSNTFGDVQITYKNKTDSNGQEVKDDEGNVVQVIDKITTDTADKVTFKAKADVDGVTELVKKFVEEYNEMVSEIKTQITTKPDSDYGPLTDDQKAEMSDTSIENWEKKAKEGLLYNNSTMRDLQSDLQSIMTTLITTKDKGGCNITYSDLEAIGITFSDDYSDGGKLVFDESTFKSAMESKPELVSNIFCGGGDVATGLTETIENTLTKYATRYASKNGNSYGRLIEEAGSSKVPLSVSDNEIYRQLKTMNEKLEELQDLLETEQDRYISQFTTMETLINKYNSQSSYLSGMSS